MAFKIEPTILNDIVVKGEKIGDYTYNKKTDTIFYELPYFFPCKFAVVSLERLYVTPMMLKLPYFLKYHNIDQLAQQLTQVKCIKNDAVLLHGAVWKQGKTGYLAVGFPNSGKTSMVLREVAKGAKFCADENVIYYSMGIAQAIKRKTSLNPWIAKEIKYPLTFKQKIDFAIAKLKSKLFPIFEPNIWVDLPYKHHDTPIDKIIFLTPGENKSLRLLTDNEFPFFTNPVLQTYAYASGWNLDEVYNKYRRLLDAVSTHAKLK